MATIQVDARGEACPIPVVKTRQAIQSLQGAGTVETLVDNEIAVQNLTKMADQKGYRVESEKQSDDCYRVLMTVGDEAVNDAPEKSLLRTRPEKRRIVAAVGADHMGEGNDELGRALIKGFLFALTMQEELPATVLFYNGGAHLTCECSDSLEDLRTLEAQGVEILTCGTCLDFYGLKEQLAVGGVTNMYDIVEKQMKADLVLRP